MNAQKIINNLKLLRAAVEAFPEERLDLGSFREERDCGTIYCTAGLAASMPEFQRQGMRFNSSFQVLVNGTHVVEDGADKLFGEKSYSNLFSTRRQCAEDGRSDKSIALWRLDRQLEAVVAEAGESK